MAYPVELKDSAKKVENSRRCRKGQSSPRLQFAEKAKLLATYHPDFRMEERKEIRIGANKGDMAPREFVRLIESASRLNPGEIDPNKVDCNTDKRDYREC